MYFDFEGNQYKEEFAVGPFKTGKWKPMPKLEYVSVFKNPTADYELNLWYYRNRHFKLSKYYDKEPAMEKALLIAEKLNIKILDATIKNNFVWVDRDALRYEMDHRDL